MSKKYLGTRLASSKGHDLNFFSRRPGSRRRAGERQFAGVRERRVTTTGGSIN